MNQKITFAIRVVAPLVLAFGGSTLAAQEQALPAPVATQEVAETALASDTAPALWQVADEDTTIYLFGTVHSLPADIDWYRGELASALASADVLVTEIDMEAETPEAVQSIIMAKAMLQGQTLRSLMDDEERAIYESALESLGLPPGALDTLEPWYAALAMSNVALAQAGFSPEAGVESVLEGLVAEGTGREALETVEFQLGIFDTLSDDAQMAFLIDGASEIDNLVGQLDALIAEWAEGDADELARLLNEAFEEDPELAERLLFARNATWAGWVENRLEAPGTFFVAVGAGHLAGEKSVQDYLAQRGIPVQRIQ